jgi:Asp-tRNA(Asn)/Glu-tRNA(Gln) amidotransferase A subunit family amidase
MPTTHGSRLFEGWRCETDAPVVRRLREAGMTVLACVNLDDFAGACFGESSVQGTMRNPYDLTRMVSGSSGGSAVSVAVGYAPVSIGTDTGGSLRIPAALCGVVTLRPTVGLVSRAGIFPRSSSQDTAGPMASSVWGVAAALDVIAGRDPDDAATLRAAVPPGGYAANLPAARRRLVQPRPNAPLAGLRLAYVRGGLAIWGDEPHGPVLARIDGVVDALRGHGATVIEVEAPPRELLDGSSLIGWESSRSVDAYLGSRPSAPVRSMAELVATGSMTPPVLAAFEVESGRDPSSAQGRASIADALAKRAELRRWTRARATESHVSAFVYPTVQQVATRIGAEQAGVFTRWSEHTEWPAIALPAGLVDAPVDDDGQGSEGAASRGLPASLELLGLPGGELDLLAIAQLVETVSGRLRRPATWRLAASI